MRKWLLPLAVAVGLLAFSAIVWFALPMIGYADTRPFESAWLRGAIIAVVFHVGGGV